MAAMQRIQENESTTCNIHLYTHKYIVLHMCLYAYRYVQTSQNVEIYSIKAHNN